MGCDSSKSAEVNNSAYDRPPNKPTQSTGYNSNPQPGNRNSGPSGYDSNPSTGYRNNGPSGYGNTPQQGYANGPSGYKNDGRSGSTHAQNGSSNLRLTYFDVEGRAEPIRMILTAGNVPFEDDRFQRTEWPQLKPKMPLGTVPVLKTSDNAPPLVQSIAIARYAAKVANLAGRNSVEMLMTDAVVDTTSEFIGAFFSKIMPIMMNPSGTSEEKKKQVFGEFLSTDATNSLKNLDKLIRLYDSNNYMVGNQLTWADIYVYSVTSSMLKLNPAILQAYPRLEAQRRAVENDQRMARYFSRRH